MPKSEAGLRGAKSPHLYAPTSSQKTNMRWVKSAVGRSALMNAIAALRCGPSASLWEREVKALSDLVCSHNTAYVHFAIHGALAGQILGLPSQA